MQNTQMKYPLSLSLTIYLPLVAPGGLLKRSLPLHKDQVKNVTFSDMFYILEKFSLVTNPVSKPAQIPIDTGLFMLGSNVPDW